jgi:hypothetical protein
MTTARVALLEALSRFGCSIVTASSAMVVADLTIRGARRATARRSSRACWNWSTGRV